MRDQPSPAQTKAQQISMRVAEVFRPARPVDALALFAGRKTQYQQLIDTINETGHHAIVYGERAVGKTSLVSVLPPLLRALNMNQVAVRQNCGLGDSFGQLWREALGEIFITETVEHGIMMHVVRNEVTQSLAERWGMSENPTLQEVRRCLQSAPGAIFIFDEFDRLPRDERQKFSDLIKMLSDHAVATTVILVGVADTVDDLVTDHQSIVRAVVQVKVPRMDPDEVRQILEHGENKLEIHFEESAKSRIVRMAQGLPHYAHLLGKHSVRIATSFERTTVSADDVMRAERVAISEVEQSVRSAYHEAIKSAHKDALYQHVLLACALAKKDEIGYFRPASVQTPMRVIREAPADIATFARHLSEFTDASRGSVLRCVGPERNRRYRFVDPLMPPFVILKGLETGLLNETKWEEINRQTSDEPSLPFEPHNEPDPP